MLNIPFMTGLLVNIQLEVLVVVEETASLLVYFEVVFVSLGRHVVPVPLADGRLYLHNLAQLFRFADGVCVAMVTCNVIRTVGK